MATNLPTTTRRGALVALAGSAALAAPGTAALAHIAFGADRSAWDAKWREYERAKAEADQYEPIADRVENLYREAREKVPHTVVGTDSGGRTLSTADEFLVADCRRSTKGVAYIEHCALRDHSDAMKLVDAADARAAKIQSIDARLGWTATTDHYESLVDRYADLEMELAGMAAPDGKAAMWKVERLFGPSESIWGKDIVDQTHADLRRFLIEKNS